MNCRGGRGDGGGTGRGGAGRAMGGMARAIGTTRTPHAAQHMDAPHTHCTGCSAGGRSREGAAMNLWLSMRCAASKYRRATERSAKARWRAQCARPSPRGSAPCLQVWCSSSSSATVGERAARTTVGLTCSHRRHERRERRDQRRLPSREKRAISNLILSLIPNTTWGRVVSQKARCVNTPLECCRVSAVVGARLWTCSAHSTRAGPRVRTGGRATTKPSCHACTAQNIQQRRMRRRSSIAARLTLHNGRFRTVAAILRLRGQ